MKLRVMKMVLAGGLAALPMVGLAQVSLQVKTDAGVVAGELIADQKVMAFKGIPYAAPPVGALRWRAPQATIPWNGVKDAKTFGYHCVQTGGYADMLFHDPGPSEDCLTLNVWTPAGAKRGSLPVMVWIYGGGYVTGGTSENRQDGQFLAHKDVVVISMNYRLGIMGFMAHPELAAESGHNSSGNYGLMDIAAALEWVKRNAAEFGGNTTNVTVFGQSAGSFAVSTVMASPLSKGLMAKAIGESGGALSSSGKGYEPHELREKHDSAFMERTFKTTKLQELRRIPTEDIVRAVTATGTPKFGPDVDGYFLPESLPEIYKAGKQAHIPVMAGWNADEGRASEKTTPTAASFVEFAGHEFGERAKDFLAVYPNNTDAEAFASAGDYGGDKSIAYSTWQWLEAQVKTGGAPVYRYFFTLGSPGDKNHLASMGAFHSDDIEYVFGALDSRPDAMWRAEDRKLSEQMQSYWVNFAKTGDPNGAGLPKWPKYGPTEWQVMHLNAAPKGMPDTFRSRYVFLDSVWGK